MNGLQAVCRGHKQSFSCNSLNVNSQTWIVDCLFKVSSPFLSQRHKCSYWLYNRWWAVYGQLMDSMILILLLWMEVSQLIMSTVKKKLPWYVLDLESYACNHYEMISILFLLMIPIPCQAHRWWELRKLSTWRLLSWCINDP